MNRMRSEKRVPPAAPWHAEGKNRSDHLKAPRLERRTPEKEIPLTQRLVTYRIKEWRHETVKMRPDPTSPKLAKENEGNAAT